MQTTESMSSAGCARFSAMSAVPYSNIDAAARATSSVVSNASRPPLKSNVCSIHSNSWCRSASGNAHEDADRLHRQLARDLADEVAAALVDRGVDECAVRARSSSSSRAIVRGVSPLLTSSRTRW